MPFKSQAQRGFLYANHPEVAAEFEKATPKGAKLPERVPRSKRLSVRDKVVSKLKGGK